MSTLPIEIARYDRLTKNGLDCDYVTGRFTRDLEFHFQIYFEDEPNEYTYKDTRISEMYIEHGGAIQWSWAGPPLDKEPDWDYGQLLLADLLEGIAFTDTQRPLEGASDRTLEYCMLRLERLAEELAQMGVDSAIFAEAVKRVAARS